MDNLFSIEKELEETPPLNFKGNGQSLIDWRIDGASGGVGNATANLFTTAESTDGSYIDLSGKINSSLAWSVTDYIEIDASTSYMISSITDQSTTSACHAYYDENKTLISTVAGNHNNQQLTTPNNAKYIRCSWRSAGITQVMLNVGTTVLPYEPYGYKIPVTCGGETNTIYVDEPLGVSDNISMTDTGITIPTVNGSNTLSVGTTVQPSNVYIKYKEGGDEMVTLAKIGGRYNTPLLEIRGLSTDTKPTTKIEGVIVANGSTYIEIDTGNTYMFDAENGVWHNITG